MATTQVSAITAKNLQEKICSTVSPESKAPRTTVKMTMGNAIRVIHTLQM